MNENRFNGRVNNYAIYRPSYPVALIDDFMKKLHMQKKNTSQIVIADIGAGTGKFTELLLERGYSVIAIEPNLEMISKLNQLKERYPHSLDVIVASAEHTRLSAKSVDVIVCAQAFHWVDTEQAQKEWISILKDDGFVALIWNQRKVDASLFMSCYEKLFLDLDGASNDAQLYRNVGHKFVSTTQLSEFFGTMPEHHTYYYEQMLDEQGLIGRVTSSSFSPTKEDKGYKHFIEQVRQLFHTYKEDEYVKMIYETECYIGKFN